MTGSTGIQALILYVLVEYGLTLYGKYHIIVAFWGDPTNGGGAQAAFGLRWHAPTLGCAERSQVQVPP